MYHMTTNPCSFNWFLTGGGWGNDDTENELIYKLLYVSGKEEELED